MKLSKLKASMATRHLAGTTIFRQNTTSSGMRNAMKKAGTAYAGESGEVEGSPAKVRLDRARRHGGRVKRDDGGRISEDSKQEAARLRRSASDDLSLAPVAKDALITGLGSLAHGLSRTRLGRIGSRALQGAGILGGVADVGGGLAGNISKNAEARRIEKGLVKEGEEDRASGGSVNGKWIQKAINPKHEGSLRKALGAKEGEPIPAKKLDKAAHSSNPTLKKRAVLAKTLKGLK